MFANTSALSLITRQTPDELAIAITALNSQGLSPNSQLGSVITSEQQLLLSPTNLSVIYVTNTTATLFWTPPPPSMRITVRREEKELGFSIWPDTCKHFSYLKCDRDIDAGLSAVREQ